MRYFYFDNKNNIPVLVALPYEHENDKDYTTVFENDFNLYIETWRDKSHTRQMKVAYPANSAKPNSEFATLCRKQAAEQNHFICDYLISLEIPTIEFESIIKDFGIIPIIT